MSTITIASAANEAYLLPLAVMMHSVCDTLSAGFTVDFRILTRGLTTKARSRLGQMLLGCPASWQEVVVEAGALNDLKLDGHISVETYFRLLAPCYISDASKVLYLDADLVVRRSITELWQTDFDGAILLAVPHASKQSGFFCAERGVPSYGALGIPGNTRTFNAGVMLLDFDAWRTAGVTAAILRYLRDYRDKVLWWDQDGLNAILYDRWRALPPTWNVMASHFRDFQTSGDSLLDPATFEAIWADPGIVHYSYLPKPWSSSYMGPFLEHWQHAARAVLPRLDAT